MYTHTQMLEHISNACKMVYEQQLQQTKMQMRIIFHLPPGVLSAPPAAVPDLTDVSVASSVNIRPVQKCLRMKHWAKITIM